LRQKSETKNSVRAQNQLGELPAKQSQWLIISVCRKFFAAQNLIKNNAWEP
jgi:hypothetical protein